MVAFEFFNQTEKYGYTNVITLFNSLRQFKDMRIYDVILNNNPLALDTVIHEEKIVIMMSFCEEQRQAGTHASIDALNI